MSEAPPAWRDASGALHTVGRADADIAPTAAADSAAKHDTHDLDVLFGRAFATPEGRTLIAALRERGEHHLTLEEIDMRVGRCRVRWATGPHNAEEAR